MDMTNWTTPAPHFSWAHLQTYYNQIDTTVYRVAIEIAQDLHLDRANPCPGCSTCAEELFWFSVTAPLAEWKAGKGRVGFLTLCKSCQLQIDFLVDDELTQMEKEDFESSGKVE